MYPRDFGRVLKAHGSYFPYQNVSKVYECLKRTQWNTLMRLNINFEENDKKKDFGGPKNRETDSIFSMHKSRIEYDVIRNVF